VGDEAEFADADRCDVSGASARFHLATRAFHDDRRLDAALIAHHYVVMRLTWDRITHEADAVLDELRRILALRAREFAA
jgi:very-short-patch-repair endonuclease